MPRGFLMEWWYVLLIPLALVVATGCLLLLIIAWPFLLCWYLGHPVVGILAELVWLALIRK